MISVYSSERVDFTYDESSGTLNLNKDSFSEEELERIIMEVEESLGEENIVLLPIMGGIPIKNVRKVSYLDSKEKMPDEKETRGFELPVQIRENLLKNAQRQRVFSPLNWYSL